LLFKEFEFVCFGDNKINVLLKFISRNFYLIIFLEENREQGHLPKRSKREKLQEKSAVGDWR
jgi:hypothetical protein